MTKKAFFRNLANGEVDVIQKLVELLNKNNVSYCVIGGLGVNAYVEPVVSLDLDLVLADNNLDWVLKAAEKYFTMRKFPHSINLEHPKSDLRIQLRIDSRYQAFIHRAQLLTLMGYEMKVASKEDILQGKIWAYSDAKRRQSKRQKDLADIFRLIEAYPHLKERLPESIQLMI